MHQRNIKGLKLPGRDETPRATPRRLPEMSCSFTQAGGSKKRGRDDTPREQGGYKTREREAHDQEREREIPDKSEIIQEGRRDDTKD